MRSRLSHLVMRLTMPDYMGILAALLLTLAFGFGVVSPLNSRSRRVSAQLQTSARERQHYAGVITSLKRVGENVAQMQATLAVSRLQLTPNGGLNHRLADLAGVANDCGLKITDIKPSDPIHNTRFVIVPIVIAGQGTYPNCTYFIRQVHERFPDLNVTRFRLSASLEGAPGGCDYEMELQWLTVSTSGDVRVSQMASINP